MNDENKNQELQVKNETNEKVIDDREGQKIFAPRSSLSRTPPQSDKTVQVAKEQHEDEDDEYISISEQSQEEGSARAHKKRKRSQKVSPKVRKQRPKSNMEDMEDMKEVNNILAKVLKRTQELKKIVSESSKTKIEIKRVSTELDNLVSNLERSFRKFASQHDCSNQTEQKESMETGIQTCSMGVSIGVQTNWEEVKVEMQEAEERTRQEIKLLFESGAGFPEIAGLLDRNWPDDIYSKTQVTYLDPGNPCIDGDLAFFMDPERIGDDKMLQNLILRHPDLQEIIEKNDGHLDYALKTVAMQTKNQKIPERTTAFYIVPLRIDKSGVNYMEEVHDLIKELKITMEVHPTNKVNIRLGEGLNLQYIRKLCECVFYNTETNVILLANKSGRKLDGGNPKKSVPAKVIVKCGDTNYADVLKTVKEKVDLNKAGVRVKTIRKTVRGDLMIQVDGDSRMAGDLQKAIRKEIKNEVGLTKNMITLHVLDIDATTTKGDVEEATRSMVIRNDPQSVIVKSMRPSWDGNQIATVQASKESANMLLRAGTIKIGWVNCRIRERVTITRCYRCLDFGHTIKECKGPDRTNVCVNCHQPGHRAKECNGVHYCPVCNSTDHRSDTTKCPKYKELLRTQAKRQKIETRRGSKEIKDKHKKD